MIRKGECTLEFSCGCKAILKPREEEIGCKIKSLQLCEKHKGREEEFRKKLEIWLSLREDFCQTQEVD